MCAKIFLASGVSKMVTGHVLSVDDGTVSRQQKKVIGFAWKNYHRVCEFLRMRCSVDSAFTAF